MKVFKEFVAGLIVPSIFVPFGLTLWTYLGHREILNILTLHWLPIIWGVWNVIYFLGLKNILPGSKDDRLFLTGAILGLIIGLVGVFYLGMPEIIGVTYYLPLIILPIVYGLVWRFLVNPLNNLLGLPE